MKCIVNTVHYLLTNRATPIKNLSFNKKLVTLHWTLPVLLSLSENTSTSDLKSFVWA